MLMTIAAVLGILWLIGFIAGVGSLIHLVLLIAIAVFAYDMFVSHRHARV